MAPGATYGPAYEGGGGRISLTGGSSLHGVTDPGGGTCTERKQGILTGLMAPGRGARLTFVRSARRRSTPMMVIPGESSEVFQAREGRPGAVGRFRFG